MSELWGTIVGALVGAAAAIISSVVVTWWTKKQEINQRRESIVGLVKAEVTAAKEMSERFCDGNSTLKEIQNATPLWKSMPPDISFLTAEQAVAARRALTLHFELQANGDKAKAQMCIDACKEALKALE